MIISMPTRLFTALKVLAFVKKMRKATQCMHALFSNTDIALNYRFQFPFFLPLHCIKKKSLS